MALYLLAHHALSTSVQSQSSPPVIPGAGSSLPCSSHLHSRRDRATSAPLLFGRRMTLGALVSFLPCPRHLHLRRGQVEDVQPRAFLCLMPHVMESSSS